MKSQPPDPQPSEQVSHASSAHHAWETRQLQQQMEFMEYGDIIRSQNQAVSDDSPMQITGLKNAAKLSPSKKQRSHLETSTQQSDKSEKLDMLPMLKEN